MGEYCFYFMADQAQQVIKHTTRAVVFAWKTFRCAIHYGIIPLIIVVGLRTTYERNSHLGPIKVTPSLFELVLPMRQLEDKSTQYIFPL